MFSVSCNSPDRSGGGQLCSTWSSQNLGFLRLIPSQFPVHCHSQVIGTSDVNVWAYVVREEGKCLLFCVVLTSRWYFHSPPLGPHLLPEMHLAALCPVWILLLYVRTGDRGFLWPSGTLPNICAQLACSKSNIVKWKSFIRVRSVLKKEV